MQSCGKSHLKPKALYNLITFQKYKLSRHYREAHPGAELNLCNMCGFRSPDAFMMQQHILKIHGGDEGGPTCPICSVRFPRLAHLTNHIQDAHDKWRPHKCGTCNFKAATEEQLAVHQKMTHENPGELI